MGIPETKKTLGHGTVQSISCVSHIYFKHIINFEISKTQMDSILNNLDSNIFS
jgi:hypothetical protein